MLIKSKGNGFTINQEVAVHGGDTFLIIKRWCLTADSTLSHPSSSLLSLPTTLFDKMGGQYISIAQIRKLSLRKVKINVQGFAVTIDKIRTGSQAV